MTPPAAGIVPVEYAVAVDRYLADADLRPGSRRVYRISLASWAWPLVGKLPPTGRGRRQASPPVVPLAILDRSGTELLLADAVTYRIRHAEARTVNRELSTLRSAVGWWRRHHWITADPTVDLRQLAFERARAAPLTQAQRAALFGLRTGLREQAFWHLLADSGIAAETALALDAGGIDAEHRRVRPEGARSVISVSAETGELLSWLLAGRRHGPLFRTDRRAPAGTPPADVCPLTGRGRMSYRRAAEIFAERTRPLDPAGRGWTLHQLRQPGSGGQMPEPAAISNAV
jgi:integrase/recombinase XerD